MPQERLAKPRVTAIFERWLEENELDVLPFTINPDMVEIPFIIPLSDEVYYCGRMDAVAQTADGKWVVIDIKTTRSISPWWISQWYSDSQVSGYTYAAIQHFGYDFVGMQLGCISLPNPLKPGKCRTHSVDTSECGAFHATFEWSPIIERSEAQLEMWRRTMLDTAAKYKDLHLAQHQHEVPADAIPTLLTEGIFVKAPYQNACNGCELMQWCQRDGRPTKDMENWLTHDPWFPFDAEELIGVNK